MKNIYFLLFCLLSLSSVAQSVYKGRVVIHNEELHPIRITNSTKGHSLQSGEYGYFFIPATRGDSIVFSSEFIITKKIVVTDSLLSRLKPVYLESNSTELKEIKINEYDANFLKLAQAQEKIYSEKNMNSNPNMDILGLIGAGIGLFVKKKPKKKVTNEELNAMEFFSPPKIVWEKNERLSQLPESFFIENIGISKHLIEPFIYFVTQSPQFSTWILTEDESVFISKLIQEKNRFLDYYNKR